MRDVTLLMPLVQTPLRIIIWLFSTVVPKNVCTRECKVTLVAFSGLFLIVDCVFSNYLSQMMHSLIGCIYLAFLHCLFSNVSSNCQLERMHNHIGCIYLAFLHCGFSNVSSNCLPKRMHNHIGCIYLASYQFLSLLQDFPHCHSFQEFSPSQNLDLSTTDVSRALNVWYSNWIG